MSDVQQRVQQDLICLRRKWPEATAEEDPISSWAPWLVTLPGFQLPEDWSPRTVTVMFKAPLYGPYRGFETREDVRCRGMRPQWSYDNGRGGTRFRWVCQMWDPNHSGFFTLAMVTRQRFCSADIECRSLAYTRRVLREAADGYARMYESFDKKRGRA